MIPALVCPYNYRKSNFEDMMNVSSYIKRIRQKGWRYFTIEQLISDLKISRNYARVAVHRLLSQGELITPAKGLYVIVPPEHQLQGSIPAEELVPILMKYINADYYVSLLSAALYHGAAHQKPNCFQVISNKRLKHSLEFNQIKIDLIYKKSLEGLPTQDRVVSTGYLKIGSPELTALDLLKYPAKSGGLNHIATVLSELVESIDENKLIFLADQIGEKSCLQRLGYILEQIDPMDEEKTNKIINKLDKYLCNKIKSFIALAPNMPKAGKPRVAKWKIITNTNIESDL